MSRTCLTLPLVTALLLVTLPLSAQSRIDGPSGGNRADALAGTGITGDLNRPGWDPDAPDGLSRPAGLPDDVSDAIEARCEGRPWRIVSGGVDTGRIVYRCEPPPAE